MEDLKTISMPKLKDRENFIDNSIVNEILQNIEQIESKCNSLSGEDAVNLRIKQLTYAKILCNVYAKDLNVLIKSYTQLGSAYLDINYYEQATEHILIAFKLIQSLQNEDMSSTEKEFQIKVLINLAKCYMEFPDKLAASQSICEKCLELNKKLFGNKHASNADIHYILAKINKRLKNYDLSIENLTAVHQINEEAFGYISAKSAEVCTDLAEIYEEKLDINNAIEHYKNSYTMWEKLISDTSQSEVFINLSIKLAELYNKAGNFHDACDFLIYVKNTENKHSEFFSDKKKLHIKFKQLIVNNAYANKDIVMYLEELLNMERVYIEYHGEYHKNIAKNCVSIAFAYLEINKKKEGFEYFDKAERIFTLCGNSKAAKEVVIKKQELLSNTKN